MFAALAVGCAFIGVSFRRGVLRSEAKCRCAVSAVAAWVLFAGPMPLRAQGSTPARSIAPSQRPPSPLVLRVEAPDTVVAGQPVAVRLILSNESDSALKVEFGGAWAPDFGLEVRADPVGPPIWSSSVFVRPRNDTITETAKAHEARILLATVGPIRAHYSRVFTVIWHQVSLSEKPVAPGVYYIKGWVSASAEGSQKDVNADPRTLVIRAR